VSKSAPGVTSASPNAGLQLHTLLVPLDGTRLAELALPPAVRLAAAAGAELVLVRVVGALEPASDAGDYLQAVAADLASKGVAASVPVRRGEPAEEILAEGRRRGPGADGHTRPFGPRPLGRW